MRVASARMYDMIEGVLKYSSLGESEQVIQTVDLNAVFESIESDLEMVIAQRRAVIERDSLPTVQGLHILLYQLFYNLVNNSLKFSREDPRINISSSRVWQSNDEYAEIVVRDTGIGFSQEHAEKIFQAFSRLHSKDRYEGTGLGLALCKKIVERHHGTISAKSKENEGSIFTIRLPLTQKANQL
jgi:signal transduction histidine kinase